MERNLSERYNSPSAVTQLPIKSKSFPHPHLDYPDRQPLDCQPIQEEEKKEAEEVSYTLETISNDIDTFISTLLSMDHARDGNVEEKEEVNEAKEGEDECSKKQEENVKIPNFVNKFLDIVEEKLIEREGLEGKGKWGKDLEDDSCFIETVTRISKLNSALNEFRHAAFYGKLINHVGEVHQRSMAYLEEEFKTLIEDFKTEQADLNRNDDTSNSQETEAVEEDNCFVGYSDDSVSNMKIIADVMINGGFEFECSQLFLVVRRQAFDVCLNKIGFEKISFDEIQKMHWENLEREIPSWTKSFKDCATIYFKKERILDDSVFADHPLIATRIFSNIIWQILIQFLNFADGIAMAKKSEAKLFKFLDMYETIRDNSNSLEELFPEECAYDLKTEMTTARCRIGEAAIGFFCDLEKSIKADTGKTPVPGGAVHPLTRYTMNYLTYASEYKATLEQVFKDHLRIERKDSTSRHHFKVETQDTTTTNNNSSRGNDENQSPFTKQLMKVMDLLDSNLEGKSRLYKDNPLRCIFKMNNGRYILQKIKSSTEIHDMLGNTWCRKKSSELRVYHKNYQRDTWNKLLGCLTLEGLQVNGKVNKPVLKERFKSFSMMFDEIHRTQTTWVVNDEQLQSELRVSISAVVIPAYRSFLGRFSQYLTPGRQYEKYIKFQPEDIETYIDELFDGNPSSGVRRRP